MKEKIVREIHDILGILDPEELRDIKTEKIIILYYKLLHDVLSKNTRCTPMCDGFHAFENMLSELVDDIDKQMEIFYCTSCMAMFKEECCCEENADNEYPQELWDKIY